VIFRQITHDDLGCAPYLTGDEDAAAAAVDPKLDVGGVPGARALHGGCGSPTCSKRTIAPTTCAVAASLLARLGASEVIHVADGGVGTWAGRGWPLAGGERG
jgi:hypothetical protein